jgi:hypothetical protein
MEAADTAETLVSIYWTTLHNIPEYSHLEINWFRFISNGGVEPSDYDSIVTC